MLKGIVFALAMQLPSSSLAFSVASDLRPARSGVTYLVFALSVPTVVPKTMHVKTLVRGRQAEQPTPKQQRSSTHSSLSSKARSNTGLASLEKPDPGNHVSTATSACGAQHDRLGKQQGRQVDAVAYPTGGCLFLQ